jgi:hypothetical protein
MTAGATTLSYEKQQEAASAYRQCNSRVRPHDAMPANNAEPPFLPASSPQFALDDDVWSGAADDRNPVEFGVRRKTRYPIARGSKGRPL